MELSFKPGQPTLLNNTTCVYCGCQLETAERTKEHVIGRRFVPSGQLAGSWNLIVWACHACNNIKSMFEDDLSAISMQPNAWGELADDDEVLRADALRKSERSFSARTGKAVKDSCERLKLSLQLALGATLSMDVVAPPQVDSGRAYALARMQLMAFFYFLTYDDATRKGKFWVGKCYCLDEVQQRDWGNPQQRTFMQMVKDWPVRLIASELANGFFRVAIRRHSTENCFSWALEWNKNYRVTGFFGGAVAEKYFNKIPRIKVSGERRADGVAFYFRNEQPLMAEDDILFAMPSF